MLAQVYGNQQQGTTCYAHFDGVYPEALMTTGKLGIGSDNGWSRLASRDASDAEVSGLVSKIVSTDSICMSRTRSATSILIEI